MTTIAECVHMHALTHFLDWGWIVCNKEKVLQRWSQYYEKHFNCKME